MTQRECRKHLRMFDDESFCLDCQKEQGMEDIVERLEEHALLNKAQRMVLFKEAKAEIERLRALAKHWEDEATRNQGPGFFMQ